MTPSSNIERPSHDERPSQRDVYVPKSVWDTPAMTYAIDRMDIPAIVRVLRSSPLTKHLSQAELGRLMHVSQSTVSCWESGHRSPHSDLAIAVLQSLGAPGEPWGQRWVLPRMRHQEVQ